jgi:NADH dehydrogenase [ubiquinone] 1 alpha subcomplex assembly factor 6
MITPRNPRWNWLLKPRLGHYVSELPLSLRLGYRRTVSTHSKGSLTDASGYCRDFVRKNDYEGFLISQFYPKDLQGGYFALRAFFVRRMASARIINSTE